MRELSKLQLFICNAGGMMLLVGAVLPIFLADATIAPYIYMAGALLYGAMLMYQRYEGNSIVIRRLRRQQVMGVIALWAAGGLMFCSLYGIKPFDGAEWQMLLAIGAVLEVYTAFRIPAEWDKEQH